MKATIFPTKRRSRKQLLAAPTFYTVPNLNFAPQIVDKFICFKREHDVP